MQQSAMKRILEACLFASEAPLTLEQLQGVFDGDEKPSLQVIQATLLDLARDYDVASFALVEVASGYTMRVKQDYASYIARLQVEKETKYSRALLETLAIIAYKQPVTRAQIEDIRGVAVNSNVIKTLMEREWIRIAGHKDIPGKPAVYVTTKAFLDYFNLVSLTELPPILDMLQYEE